MSVPGPLSVLTHILPAGFYADKIIPSGEIRASSPADPLSICARTGSVSAKRFWFWSRRPLQSPPAGLSGRSPYPPDRKLLGRRFHFRRISIALPPPPGAGVLPPAGLFSAMRVPASPRLHRPGGVPRPAFSKAAAGECPPGRFARLFIGPPALSQTASKTGR